MTKTSAELVPVKARGFTLQVPALITTPALLMLVPEPYNGEWHVAKRL